MRPTAKLGAVLLLASATLAGCIGPGTILVGNRTGQAKPGLYTAAVPVGGHCSWERLLDASGEYSGMIANGFIGAGREFVQIASTDRAFESAGCSIWTSPKVASYNPNRFTARPGAYRVPTDLLPGTYAAPGGPQCYWERVSSWLHDDGSVIADDASDGPQQVTIAKSDKGFTSQGCGDWKRIGN